MNVMTRALFREDSFGTSFRSEQDNSSADRRKVEVATKTLLPKRRGVLQKTAGAIKGAAKGALLGNTVGYMAGGAVNAALDTAPASFGHRFRRHTSELFHQLGPHNLTGGPNQKIAALAHAVPMAIGAARGWNRESIRENYDYPRFPAYNSTSYPPIPSGSNIQQQQYPEGSPWKRRIKVAAAVAAATIAAGALGAGAIGAASGIARRSRAKETVINMISDLDKLKFAGEFLGKEKALRRAIIMDGWLKNGGLPSYERYAWEGFKRGLHSPVQTLKTAYNQAAFWNRKW